MRRGILIGLASVGVALVALGVFLYSGNRAPVVAPLPALANKPVVVKLHAQWCPVCMVTQDVWTEIESAYGDRIHLVVFDFTDDAATDSSRAEAARLGLQAFFDEYGGWTGTIAVLDARSKNVLAAIHGSRSFDEYRQAIDAAFAAND